MLINHYDPATGEFISQTVANRDPLNPSDYLLPAFSILNNIAPLPAINTNQAAVYNGKSFDAVDDYRGGVQYYDKTTGGKVTFNLGGKPDNTMSTTFPATVQKKIDDEAARVKRKSDRDSLLKGLTHDFGDGRVIQVRPKDESNIRNAIEIMVSQSLTSINWVMNDNKKYLVTSAELKRALQAGQLAALNIWNNYVP